MEFNSLDAQREAALAYIESQKHEGWMLVRDRYDDGGFSGGNLERPALQRLLRDVEGGRIDVIVVYKVDRLSRSLTDFARIVEVFERHDVSFVSVTQQFNTTTSMGRLTLNILLSFAQFEREVIGERIRDKFAASRRKGMWMGGIPPLGYDVADRKLVVNETEAELVRLIFKRFLRVGSATKLAQELRRAGHTTKSWTTQDGNQRPGKPIDKGAIYKILNNRVYLGEAVHKGTCYPGEHDGDRRSRDLGQGARHPRREYRRSRQRHAGADAGVAARPDLRARRPRDDAVAHAQGRQAVPVLRRHRRHPPGLLGMRGAQRAGGRGRRGGRRASAASAAHARDHCADVGGGEAARSRCRSARSSRPSPTSRRCGMSSSRPSRRGSSGCWSSGSTSRPMACRFGCAPRGCRRWSRSCGHGRQSGMKTKRKMVGKNWEFDGSTITVRIPMTWKRRGGRKVIIAPDGGDAWAPAKPRPDETLIRALARAHRWKRMLEEGTYRSAGRSPKPRASPAASSTGCYG